MTQLVANTCIACKREFDGVGLQCPVCRSGGKPTAPVVAKAPPSGIARRLELTLPWSCLAPDNLRKGVAGTQNRAKQGRYSEALARARARLRDDYDRGPMQGPLQLRVEFWMPDDRPRDPTNFLKCLLDALREIVIVDDRWQELRDVRVITRGIDGDSPRCMLTIEPYENHETRA